MAQFSTITGVIHYELLGEVNTNTPKITLLHNFLSTGRMAWGGVYPKLEGFQILLADLPGHGRSIGHPADYDYYESGKQIADLMDTVGFAAGHLAGCSAGGVIAQLMIESKLLTPASLTLVSTTYTSNPANSDQITTENFIAAPNWLDATAKLHDPYQGEGYFYRELLPGFNSVRTGVQHNLSLEALSTFTFPTCIIHGELDEFFPVTVAEEMHAAIPNSELHLIPEQTHALIFRKPWVVGEILRTFLLRTEQ